MQREPGQPSPCRWQPTGGTGSGRPCGKGTRAGASCRTLGRFLGRPGPAASFQKLLCPFTRARGLTGRLCLPLPPLPQLPSFPAPVPSSPLGVPALPRLAAAAALAGPAAPGNCPHPPEGPGERGRATKEEMWGKDAAFPISWLKNASFLHASEAQSQQLPSRFPSNLHHHSRCA